MARIAPLDESQMDARTQGILAAAEEMLGFSPNDGRLMAHAPDVMLAFLQLNQAIYAPGEVAPELKRLIGLVTSTAAGCTYCQSHTQFSAHRLGVPEEKLKDVWSYATSEHFNDAERAALTVAMKAGQSPSGVTDEDMAELARHFSVQAQIEIVAVISLFGFLNRWNSTLGTDLEAAPAALSAQLKPD